MEKDVSTKTLEERMDLCNEVEALVKKCDFDNHKPKIEINGKVKVSGEYFLKMAKADYRNYRQALWREIYQNSIDAGASEIQVSFNKEEQSMTVMDNGCGMDVGTLVDKLLALGGTKKAEGSVGAFGKAKELELFSWKGYMLHTHNLLLMGSGDDYSITETEDNVDGTSITLYIQENEDFGDLCSFAEDVAKKIETNCKIYVEGNPIDCKRQKGEFRKSLDVGDVYVNDNLPSNYYAQVRMNGIWMFEQYVGSDIPHVTLELSEDSIKAMTSNRDGLKNNALNEAQQFFLKLAADRKSALFPDKVQITLHAKGSDGEQIHVSDQDMDFMKARFSGSSREEFLAAFAKFISIQNEDGDEKLNRMRINGTDHNYDRLKYFGFRWDTVHKFEKGQEKHAKDFIDGSAAKARRAKTLLTMWGENLKQVLLDIETYTRFTVGFNWNENQQSSLVKEDGKLYFYLNPNILAKYPLTNKKELARKLRLLATHEIIHLDREYHDEYFMQMMEDTIEKTWKSDKLYEQIAKSKG